MAGQLEFNRFGPGGGFASKNTIVLEPAEGSPARIQLFWTQRRVRQQEYNCFGHSGGSAGENSIVLDQMKLKLNVIIFS